jgi:hypothetical protein
MRRRTFLVTTLAGVGGLMADRLPTGEVPLGIEPLEQFRLVLDRLRRLDGQAGGASILMPATFLAARLTRALRNTPSPHPLRRPLASLTADATELAGWVGFETGDYPEALYWYGRSIDAASSARDLDFTAFAKEGRARVLWSSGALATGLSSIEDALGQLDDIQLDGVCSQVRARIYDGRARALAKAGRDGKDLEKGKACLHALDQAAAAAANDGPPWAGWLGTPGHIELEQGLTLADLGNGHEEEAYRLLKGSLRRLPTRLRRVSGTSHRGLAQAALLMGEPVLAAEHVLKAHQAFTATKSSQLATLQVVTRNLEARYGDVAEVRNLTEHLRVESRYVTTRTSARGQRVHQRSCPSLNRGQTSNAEAWPDGNGLEPAEVAVLVEARATEGRSRLGVCRHCMVAR